MTGPEHYREAEKFLKFASGYEAGSASATDAVAEAQVHATLALAAATAMQPSRYAVGRPEFEQWRAEAGVEKRSEAAA